jgi:hypothetical protein
MVRPFEGSSEIGTCTLSKTLILPYKGGCGMSALHMYCCFVRALQMGSDEGTQSLQKIPSAECSAGAVQRSSLMAAHEHEHEPDKR